MRYDSFAHKGFQEKGMTYVIVTRTDDAGWLHAGVFLLDLYCLGVKDAFAAEMNLADWPEQLDRLIPAGNRLALHPACARKLVEGAVRYAEALGFAPHRDYKKARRVFGSVSSRDCPESFTYGKDGKPLYVAGPHDDQQRIGRVLRTLTAKLGPDGFHYIVPAGPDAPASSVREDFLALFQERPEGPAGFAAADGFLAALHVCPDLIKPSDFLPVFWGDAEPEFQDEDAARRVLGLVMTYWNEVGERLREAADDDDPERAVDFGDNPVDANRLYASAWCRGFLRTVDAWPAAWKSALDRPELRRHFDAIATVAAYAGGAAPAGVIAPAEAEELPGYVGTAVLALYSALLKERMQ